MQLPVLAGPAPACDVMDELKHFELTDIRGAPISKCENPVSVRYGEMEQIITTCFGAGLS